MCVPIAASWWFSGTVLSNLGQDRDTVELAEKYCRILIGGLWPAVIFEVTKKYLQAQGIVLPTMAAAAVGAVTNGILAYEAVYKSSLGLMGAAVAQVVSQWVMAGIGVGYAVWLHLARRANAEGYGKLKSRKLSSLQQSKSSASQLQQAPVESEAGHHSHSTGLDEQVLDLSPRQMPITWGGLQWTACFSVAGWLEFLGLGLPGMLMSIMEWAVYEASSVAAGLLGKEQLAAHAVLAQAGALSYMVPLGVSVAAGVRVGQMLGAKDPAGAKRATSVAVFLGWIAVTITASTFYLARWPWASAFSEDAGVREAAANSMYMLAIFTLLDQYQCVLSGIMRGMGRQGAGAIVNVVSYLGAELPLAFVLSGPAGLGLDGVWLGIFIGVVISSVMLTWLTLRSDWEKQSRLAAERASGPGGHSGAPDGAGGGAGGSGRGAYA